MSWREDGDGVGRTVVAVAVLPVLAGVVGLVWWSWGPSTYVASWDEPEVSADGRTLWLRVAGGGCDASYTSEVDYSSSRVQVTVIIARKQGDCSDDAALHTAVIDLEEPLGSRPVLDGRCTHPDATLTRAVRGCPAKPVYPELHDE